MLGASSNTADTIYLSNFYETRCIERAKSRRALPYIGQDNVRTATLFRTMLQCSVRRGVKSHNLWLDRSNSTVVMHECLNTIGSRDHILGRNSRKVAKSASRYGRVSWLSKRAFSPAGVELYPHMRGSFDRSLPIICHYWFSELSKGIVLSRCR